MAVIALPDGPEDRCSKWGDRAMVAVIVVIFALFAFSLLDAYVF